MGGVTIAFPTFQKAMRTITAITNGNPALITTDPAHQYVSGQIVRILIPSLFGGNNLNQYTFGMIQINNQMGVINVINTTQFYIDIDTTNYDAFSIPPNIIFPIGPSDQLQYAQVVPVGELATQLNASTVNILPYAPNYPNP